LYDAGSEINSETGLITEATEVANVFNKFFIQLSESLNNRYINLQKALQLLEKADINEIWK
jgi:2,3-bisphosphoglycerate-independent phosphoglycerate mutase